MQSSGAEAKAELTSAQAAAVRRIYASEDFQNGIVPLVKMFQEVEMAKLTNSDSEVSVYRAQGGFKRLQIFLDFAKRLATVAPTNP